MQDFTGGPGFMAFVVTFTLVTLTVVLMRSLNKHLRKVRTQSPAAPMAEGVAAMDGTSRAKDGNGSGDVVADKAHDR